jgi:hypothetical protein
MKNKVLSKFDKEFVASRVGYTYNWKASAMSRCTDVRKMLKSAIKRGYQMAVEDIVSRKPEELPVKNTDAMSIGWNDAIFEWEQKIRQLKYKTK